MDNDSITNSTWSFQVQRLKLLLNFIEKSPCNVTIAPTEFISQENDGLVESLGHHDEVEVRLDLEDLGSNRGLVGQQRMIETKVPKHLVLAQVSGPHSISI